MICIDVDELIVMNRDEQDLENHIPRYLEKIPDEYDQVLALNLESIPNAAETTNLQTAFTFSTAFQHRNFCGATRARRWCGYRVHQNSSPGTTGFFTRRCLAERCGG
jgi:hypothetical protein